MIREALKPVLEELRQVKEEMELWKTQCLELMEVKIKESYGTLEFKTGVETAIINSDQKILPRLQDTEKITGQWDFEGDEHPPTLPERIEALELRPVSATEKPMEPVKPEPLIPPRTSLERKAVVFADWLYKKPYSPTGIKQADDKEIKEFINSVLDEKLRGKDKSVRKIKMRLINKVKELYPDIICTHKSNDGRHETSVFVKNSFQTNRTVRTSLMLAGEML